jgi:hypothetical protein
MNRFFYWGERSALFANDIRLVVEKFEDIQVVTIAEFYIDNRRIFVFSLLSQVTGRLTSVFVVILRRRPEMEHHLTAAACDFDTRGAEFFYLSNDKRVPRYRFVSRAHLCSGIEPFGKIGNGISLGNVHASIVGQFQNTVINSGLCTQSTA